jgi:hypothetical protein
MRVFLVRDTDVVHHQPGICLARLRRPVALFLPQEDGDRADLCPA